MSKERRFTMGHHGALMLALEKQRVDFVRLLCTCPNFNLEGINLTALYYSCLDKYSVLDDEDLVCRFDARIGDISRTPVDATTGEPLSTHGLYKAVIGPFILMLIPELHRVIETSQHTAWHDLVIWATINGYDDLLFELWKHCELPVRTALWAACVARRMTNYMLVGRAECFERADRIESWAIGVLNAVPTRAEAARILAHVVPAWGRNYLIDVAMLLEMRNFLSHNSCQSLMDDWFKGGFPGSSMQLKENDSMMILWFYLLLPPFNPYLYTNSGDGGSGSSLSMDSVAAVSSALMAAHRLAKVEMQNQTSPSP